MCQGGSGRDLFPFLFGGTFIEGWSVPPVCGFLIYFPSFSEGLSLRVLSNLWVLSRYSDFPSFSEGLSLRVPAISCQSWNRVCISLPFRRDFH